MRAGTKPELSKTGIAQTEIFQKKLGREPQPSVVPIAGWPARALMFELFLSRNTPDISVFFMELAR